MFANKLTALLDRKRLAHRDIFDIWFMLNNHWDLNEALLKLRTKTEPKKNTCKDALIYWRKNRQLIF